jgi:hypothetical protein
VPSIFLRKYAGFQAMCRIGRPLPGEEKVDRVAGDGMSTAGNRRFCGRIFLFSAAAFDKSLNFVKFIGLPAIDEAPGREVS